jgi:hypothetical protein
MSAIDKLSKVTTLSGADLVALFSSSAGSDVAATLATLATYLQTLLTTGAGFITQYAAPSATGFSVTIAPVENGGSVYLNLTPVAGYAAGTITLPAVATCQDGQEVLVSSTNSVTTLTIAANGSSVTGGPTTLAAGAFFRLRFDGVFKTWARVG